MTVNRDKLGEFILVSEAFNRYEEFAASADNFATVDEADPEATGQGDIDLYKDSATSAEDERRVLIYSDHVYGKTRQAVFYIDLAQVTTLAGDWLYAVANYFSAPPSPAIHAFSVRVALRARAITADFDPAAVTWDDAYGASPALTFDSHVVEQLVVKVDESINCIPSEDADYDYGTGAFAPAEAPRSLENVMLKCDVPEWNALDAVYGFEVTLQLMAQLNCPGVVAFDKHIVRYRGTGDDALGFAIRK